MIRIISGNLRRKKLHTLPGKSTRPTSDRLRESIFNILNQYPAPKIVVDLFAGTGALGFEAMSRGASFTYFVDNSPKAIDLIKKNAQTCALSHKIKILKWDILKNLNCLCDIPKPADLVFMDPPYDMNFIHPSLVRLLQSPIMAPHTMIVVEHSLTESILLDKLHFQLLDQREYSHARVSFLTPKG